MSIEERQARYEEDQAMEDARQFVRTSLSIFGQDLSEMVMEKVASRVFRAVHGRWPEDGGTEVQHGVTNEEVARARTTLKSEQLPSRAGMREALEEFAASHHLRLIELLEEVRDKGLIYWEPQTERGHVAKADMLRRIDREIDG